MSDIHLRVYSDRSEFHSGDDEPAVFLEGPSSPEALKRIRNITKAFAAGFLQNVIESLTSGSATIDDAKISEKTQNSLSALVESVTSEVGRALVGLSVMQLCIKAIDPKQSIRLHKSSPRNGSFSWREGVSMRTLDKSYVTPVLRRYKLVSLNADGFMMTRSLAENYPYSPLYKAQLRGAREEWLTLVQELETDETDALESLKYFLSLLLNAASNLVELGDRCISLYRSNSGRFASKKSAMQLLLDHSNASDYSARLLEIGMHSLIQAAVASGALGSCELKALSQMRSANKKHGNIADIELLADGEIVEAWDAKYGKSYLRDELEEVAEKLVKHDHVRLVGFVSSVKIERINEIEKRIAEIEAAHGVEVCICSIETWVDSIFDRCGASGLISESELASGWVSAYVESLAQRRREIAPIDEPCESWLKSFLALLALRAL
jgi:hypothetical protein